MKLLVRRPPPSRSAEIAAWSQCALDVPLASAAELWVSGFTDDATFLGAFQRNVAPGPATPVFQRGSGGPSVPVGPRTLHVAVVLAHASALTSCPPPRLVNRHVRPLLKALGHLGAPAHYFGRDTVNVKHRPVGWVGFAHDAGSGRAVMEAFVQAASLEEVLGKSIDLEVLASDVVKSYLAAYAPGDASGVAHEGPLSSSVSPMVAFDPPWAATVPEAIGPLGAGADAGGGFRVGGDWLVSRDAVGALEAAVSDLPVGGRAAVAELVNDVFSRPGVVLDGVRALGSVAEVISLARGGGAGR